MATSNSQPITLHIPPALAEYNKTAASLLTNRKAKAVAVGAFVFAHPPDGEARLLLVQREKGDGRLAGKWEVPGGGTEDRDPTVFHSTARELFEEAGLHMTSAVDKVGSDHYFLTRGGLSVVKLSFEVRVQEPVDGVALENIPVALSDEHQSFVWATEADLHDEEKYPTTHPEQRQANLTAFKQHKARLSEVRNIHP